QDGNREWVILLASVCADGSALPLGIIFTGADNTIQSWTNNSVGLAWVEQLFDRYTKKKARRSWRLLIVDGHGSHLTMAFIDYCDRHRILLLIFPPHATHVLQLLDVVLFAPLATQYSAAAVSHLHNSQGLLGVHKSDFFRLFYKAWESTF
ncbi:DDE-domain-containing protein, partial [Didymella exigua CBS 183.55]